jgi:N6-L-threonylcarbamoyladenine synthase
MLAEAAERSLAYTRKKEVLLTGGVAANRTLQKKLSDVAGLHDATPHVVNQAYTGDCGPQIAWTGILALRAGVTTAISKSYVKPRWRLEDVDIVWRREAS